MWNASAPVVVGIDGSDAAINAAIWAIDEAISREAPLRLVQAIQAGPKSPASVEIDDHLERQFAETSLRRASAAVHATGTEVKVETEIIRDDAHTALIGQSAEAAVVCLGSTGIGFFAREILGSTAEAVAENAYCPVAIIRSPYGKPTEGTDWIVVGVDDRTDNDVVIEHALDEARLRKAPVLAVGDWQDDLGEKPYPELDRRLDVWRHRCPDIQICPVATRSGMERFLAENRSESVQLAVIGRADASSVAAIIGPHGHELIPHGECSVLVVR